MRGAHTNRRQTFQEVTKEVVSELKKLPHLKVDLQSHFYKLKQEEPKRFERLIYNENAHSPYSDDLYAIIDILKMSGIITHKYEISGNL